MKRTETKDKTDYNEQAANFLRKTEASIKVNYSATGKYFDDDEHPRDIYTITITKGGRNYIFQFGQSYNCSGKWWAYGDYRRGIAHSVRGVRLGMPLEKYGARLTGHEQWERNKDYTEPTAYDILAAITKSDPGTFEQFCPELGYDTDSRSAEKTYQAVKNEYSNLCQLFSDAELEEMQEIV